MTDSHDDNIRTSLRPECILCGSPGKPLYQGLEDRLFGAPGVWSVDACTNPECGLLWLNPAPLKEDMGKAYKTYYTHAQPYPQTTLINRVYWAVRDGYLQARFGYLRGVGPRGYRLLAPLAWLHPSGPVKLGADVLYLKAPTPGMRLLEIGCGDGRFLQRMQALGWNTQGIDPDPQAVEQARQRGLTVQCGELFEQNFPDQYFDAICMNHVIEHVYDPVGLLVECRRVLKAHGTVTLVTPNTDSLGHQRYGEDWRGLEPPRHLHLFSPGNLIRAVERAGLNVVTVHTLAKGAAFMLNMSSVLRRARLSNRGIEECSGGFSRALGYRLFQIGERMLLTIRPQIGEEILLIAGKTVG